MFGRRRLLKILGKLLLEASGFGFFIKNVIYRLENVEFIVYLFECRSERTRKGADWPASAPHLPREWPNPPAAPLDY